MAKKEKKPDARVGFAALEVLGEDDRIKWWKLENTKVGYKVTTGIDLEAGNKGRKFFSGSACKKVEDAVMSAILAADEGVADYEKNK